MNEVISSHPDNTTLQAYADGTLSKRNAEVERHLRLCESCGNYVSRIRALDSALAALPERAGHIPAIDDMIANYRADQNAPRHSALHNLPIVWAAAAVLLFAAGLGTGLAMDRSPSRTGNSALASPTELAFEVQRTGSSYVAALARLHASAASRHGSSASMAREVAASTLYGAASEAAFILQSDPSSRNLVEMARAVREESASDFGGIPQ